MPSGSRLVAALAAVLAAACTRAEPPRIAHAAVAAAPAPFPAPAGPSPSTVSAPPPSAPIPVPPPAPSAAPPAWPPAPPGIDSDFCLPGAMETLADDACYVLPAQPTATLLVYLPGMMPPGRESPEKRTVETVVANAARRAGVAALLLRGPSRAELAAPARDPMGIGAYRSWPTGDDTYRRHARRLVDHILAKRQALEALVGGRFERVFLGGSSAGAYFVAHLALRGDFPADGYAVLSGGSARPSPRLADLPKHPLYVGYGDGDVAGAKAAEVAAQARAAGWIVQVAVHHTGHGSREVYLDEAFAFFGVAPR